CGHDAHAAIVAGVAEVLARHRQRLRGRVAFVFQPADEPMRGARRMIEGGVLARAAPGMSLAVHVLPMLGGGQVVAQRGPSRASRDRRVREVAGPPPPLDTREGLDVARTAAALTTALYDLVETEARSIEPVVFRVRSLRAEQGGRGSPSQA